MTPSEKASLINKLKAFLPLESVLHHEEDLRPYECDALSAYRKLPQVVCLPDTIDQIQRILKVCLSLKVPVIARGAGTGLSGGTLPIEESLIISLSKFNRMIDVDENNCVARVEPGVRNLAISEAATEFGLYYAPDPSSQIACSIGGNVAENAGGVHCLKYGLTVQNVLGIKIITMDGTLLTLGGKTYDDYGYDLLALMTGSEGLLGIICEVTVKLLPKPDTSKVTLAAFSNITSAANAVNAIISSGITPAGLEMMDSLAIKAAEDFIHAGYPTDAAAILLCELDGSADEVDLEMKTVQSLMLNNGAYEQRLSIDEADRMKLWAGRKAAFPAVGRISPDYYCMDGTIPRKHLPAVLDEISRLSNEYQLPVANVFHAGDGNLHPLILFDANKNGELERTEEFGGKILEYCIKMGGTITGEHGVGFEKLNQMCSQFTSHELKQFHAIKSAFDPEGLLNPGKAIPTLHRCAEMGAMHVHRGQLPFPELDRF